MSVASIAASEYSVPIKNPFLENIGIENLKTRPVV